MNIKLIKNLIFFLHLHEPTKCAMKLKATKTEKHAVPSICEKLQMLLVAVYH